jgi:hypothetical protein
MITEVLLLANSTRDSLTLNIKRQTAKTTLWQFVDTGVTSFSCDIQGRLSPTAPWVTIGASVTAAGIQGRTGYPEMRASLTAIDPNDETISVYAATDQLSTTF